MEYNDELVKEAIQREVARGGQVYYVYNRVKNIDEKAADIQRLVPSARVAYGHGQMGEHELERVMMDFVSGHIDVLVSTTIIETGIDIPNVNTIIIHDADTFGLAQLYQLRGRVGRGARRAFAFLMYRRDKLIKETAEKRLAAIREFTDLGSGFKIAMRDLEIRGAGNVLGEDQSGHMEAVGYDLYCKMLQTAIAEMKGEVVAVSVNTVMEVELNAYISAQYVRNEFQKLELYKRIAELSTRDDLEDMVDELIDRYGEIPSETKNLLEIALLKNTASKYYITKLRQAQGKVVMQIYPQAPVDIGQMDKLLKGYRGQMTFSQETVPTFTYQCGHVKEVERLPLLWELVEQIGGIMENEECDA
jgi:transcription-repair coupling factor (superfamily II helicase)